MNGARPGDRGIPPRRGRRGNCYVTCEALYHLLGGKTAGLVPHRVRHEGDVHWYLVRDGNLVEGDIIDPTAAQFDEPPPYHLGRACGFLTKGPSRRAQELMDRMMWQEQKPARGRSK